MTIRQVYRQVTEHGTEIQMHEDTDNPHAFVEVVLFNLGEFDPADGPIYLSLTPAEARSLADAILTSSQRVEDRAPHLNS